LDGEEVPTPEELPSKDVPAADSGSTKTGSAAGVL
jgi:hypothetical protein